MEKKGKPFGSFSDWLHYEDQNDDQRKSEGQNGQQLGNITRASRIMGSLSNGFKSLKRLIPSFDTAPKKPRKTYIIMDVLLIFTALSILEVEALS